jgi:hypothetical protein
MLKRFSPLALAAAFCVLCFSDAVANPVAGPPYELNAVVPLTGGGAFLGRAYQDTFRALEKSLRSIHKRTRRSSSEP